MTKKKLRKNQQQRLEEGKPVAGGEQLPPRRYAAPREAPGQKCLLPKVFEFIHLPEEDHPRQCQGIQVCCVLAAATIVCMNGTLYKQITLSQKIKYSFKARCLKN